MITTRLILALLIFSSGSTFAQVVSSVEFEGKHKIRNWILNNEIDLRPGSEFDPRLWQLDRKRISSLGIFSHVKSDTSRTEEGIAITYDIKEQWTIIPILSVGGEIDNLDIDIGVMDKDFLGLYVEPGLVFSHFEDRNSFSTWLDAPRAVGRKISLGVSFAKTHTLEPADTRSEPYEFEYDARQIGGSVSVGYRISERFSASVALQYRKEEYTLLPAPVAPINLEVNRDQRRLRPSAGLAIGRIYYDDYFYEGIQTSLSGSLTGFRRHDFDFRYWVSILQAKAFRNFDGRFNLGAQCLIGRSRTDDILPAFAITGLSNVRGAEDRTRRGENIYHINTDVRWRLYQNSWLHSQLVVFVDNGNVWDEDPYLGDIIEESYLTYGIGARLGLVRFYNAIGRMDVALNTRNGVVTVYVSAGQFF